MFCIACAEECSALKKHFDECNERVENGSSENCKCWKDSEKKKEKEKLIYILGVEEFFHFMHCADECVSSLYLLSFDMC